MQVVFDFLTESENIAAVILNVCSSNFFMRSTSLGNKIIKIRETANKFRHANNSLFLVQESIFERRPCIQSDLNIYLYFSV